MGWIAATLVACAAVAAGCSTCERARRTLLEEPAEYSWRQDRNRSLKTYRQWAQAAWAEQGVNCGDGAAGEEYALGFTDGFVDFVYAGGQGEPPPLPPRRFWNVAWRTTDGRAAAGEWFEGYRHGAQAARVGGYRQQALLQSSYIYAGSGAWDGLHEVQPQPFEQPAAEVISPPMEPMPTPSDSDAQDDDMLPVQPAPRDEIDELFGTPPGNVESDETQPEINAPATNPDQPDSISRRPFTSTFVMPVASTVELAVYNDGASQPGSRVVPYGAPASGLMPTSAVAPSAAATQRESQGGGVGSTLRFVR